MDDQAGSDWGGPFVACALVYHQVTREADGTQDIRGIYDSVVIEAGESPKLRLIVLVRAGDRSGPAAFRFDIVDPASMRQTVLTVNLEFTPSWHLTQCPVSITLDHPYVGVYWIEVWINDRLATKVPMRVLNRSLGEATAQ